MLVFLPSPPFIEAGTQFKGALTTEYRMRFERRLDRDFNPGFADDRSDLFQRVRVGLNWSVGAKLTGLVQYQYAHDLFWTGGRNASDMAGDVFQAYADLKMPEGSLRVGRQRVDVAGERLVGSTDWLNLGRSLDAVRYQSKSWEALAGRPGFPRLQNVRLGMVSVKSPLGATMAVYKHDQLPTGAVDHLTLSHSYARRFGAVDLEGEGALQVGRTGGRDQRAWAIHLQAGTRLGPSTAAALEVNSASGGGDANTSRTFDNLYPTNHKFYGLMDLHAWKNVDMVAFNLTHKFTKDLDVKFRAASSALRDPADSWYGASGAPNRHAGGAFLDPTGASGRDLGREIDFEVNWKRSVRDTVSVGVGVFSPGSFVKKLAGSSRSQTFGYVQYGVRF